MKFNPGFRISKLDIAFIIVALGFAVWLYGYSAKLSFVVLFVVAHFFLFCNIVRMSRTPELIWGSIFSIVFISSMQYGFPPWYAAISLALVATVVLVALELKKPSYHGVFWIKVNPELPEWFSRKNGNQENS